MNTENSNKSLEQWRRIVSEKLGWGPVIGWGDYDFEKLSDQIFAATATRLSISTLKRIFGKVRYDSAPNLVTLNALAVFIGFEDWRLFTQSLEQGAGIAPIQNLSTGKPSAKRRRPLLFVALGFVIIVTLGFLLFPAADKDLPVSFTSRKITDGIPNSVVFDYDASAFHSDSVYIQQSWDPERTEKVPGNGRQHTSIYYYPGFFTAKILVDGKLKKETPVFIPSNGWIGIIDHKPVPTYLDRSEIHHGGYLGITDSLFARKSGSPVFNDNWIRFYNIQQFGNLKGDDLEFTTILRNTSLPGQSACQHVNIYILGNSNAIIIPLSGKGCTASLDLHTGEQWIAGKDHDLSKFGCDFSVFHHLTCRVSNGKLSISLDEEPAFQATITQPIGDIIGIAVAFEGAGEIKDIQIGNRNKILYNPVN